MEAAESLRGGGGVALAAADGVALAAEDGVPLAVPEAAEAARLSAVPRAGAGAGVAGELQDALALHLDQGEPLAGHRIELADQLLLAFPGFRRLLAPALRVDQALKAGM